MLTKITWRQYCRPSVCTLTGSSARACVSSAGSSGRRPFSSCRHSFHGMNFCLWLFFCWNLLLHKCSERSWKQKGLDKPLRPCKLSHVANWGPAGKEERRRRRRRSGTAKAAAVAVAAAPTSSAFRQRPPAFTEPAAAAREAPREECPYTVELNLERNTNH